METALQPLVITVTLNPAIDQNVSVPGFTAGAVNRVESTRTTPGGKGVNVASALADMGHRVAATGFLGRENAGLFEELFRRKNIHDGFIRIAGQTRTGIKIIDRERGETTDINFPGAAPSATEVDALRARVAELAQQGPSWVVLAGSLPPGVASTIYRDLSQSLRRDGHRVVLDTSGAPLTAALEAVPHVFKPNIHELEELTGQPLGDRAQAIAAARTFIQRGAELVAVSMGADGALFITSAEVVLATPPAVEVRTTVGAGDAMVAGTIAAQLRQLSLADCARMATAFSLEALTRGESGVSSPSAIEAGMRQVTIAHL